MFRLYFFENPTMHTHISFNNSFSSLFSADTTLTISGIFGSDISNVRTTVGHKDCQISEINNTNIICVVGPLPVGENAVDVYVGNKGRASSTAVVTSEKIASVVSPLKSSIYGGAQLVIEGNGFVQTNTAVDVAGMECLLVNVTYDKVIILSHASY